MMKPAPRGIVSGTGAYFTRVLRLHATVSPRIEISPALMLHTVAHSDHPAEATAFLACNGLAVDPSSECPRLVNE